MVRCTSLFKLGPIANKHETLIIKLEINENGENEKMVLLKTDPYIYFTMYIDKQH